MKSFPLGKGLSGIKRGLAVSLLVLSSVWVASGDGIPQLDPCESEALKAYWQALKVCQLAEPQNPRLRCYEAAKAVYLHTLQECRDGLGKTDE